MLLLNKLKDRIKEYRKVQKILELEFIGRDLPVIWFYIQDLINRDQDLLSLIAS